MPGLGVPFAVGMPALACKVPGELPAFRRLDRTEAELTRDAPVVVGAPRCGVRENGPAAPPAPSIAVFAAPGFERPSSAAQALRSNRGIAPPVLMRSSRGRSSKGFASNSLGRSST